MKPHKHAEIIKAWADGNKIQWRGSNKDMEWMDVAPIWWDEGKEYRVKPAAPKWPQTTMTGAELGDWFQSTRLTPLQIEVIMDGVNKAIAKECQSGALVPADKVREIEAKAKVEGQKDIVCCISAMINNSCGSLNHRDLQSMLQGFESVWRAPK